MHAMPMMITFNNLLMAPPTAAQTKYMGSNMKSIDTLDVIYNTPITLNLSRNIQVRMWVMGM